jgi:hypothetical protein
MAVLVLACGTLIYYHCAVRNRNIVALISDVLFVISWSLALLGLIFRFLNLTYACLAGSLSLSLSLSLSHTHTHTLSVSMYVCVYVWVCWCGCFLGAVVFLSLQCMNERRIGMLGTSAVLQQLFFLSLLHLVRVPFF